MNSKNFILILLAMFIFVMVFIAVVIGWDRQDKSDCLKWQEEALTYEGYYLTKSQKEQCDYFGVEVAAPLK